MNVRWAFANVLILRVGIPIAAELIIFWRGRRSIGSGCAKVQMASGSVLGVFGSGGCQRRTRKDNSSGTCGWGSAPAQIHIARMRIARGRTRRLHACWREFVQQLVRAAAAALRVCELGCCKGRWWMRYKCIGDQLLLATTLRVERAGEGIERAWAAS